MKRVLKTAVFTLCLAALSHAAVLPTQNLTPFSLAAEYYGMLNGPASLYDFDSTALGSHFLRLHYAPYFFLRFTGGIGGSHAYTSQSIKGGRVGISATAGFGLYTPKLFNFLTITGGADGYYLTASERQNIYHHSQIPGGTETRPTGVDTFYVGIAREGRTAAALATPYIGARFHLGRFGDLEVGGQYFYFDLLTKDRTERNSELLEVNGIVSLYETGTITVTAPRSQVEQLRAYAALTLHERESGAYLTSGFSAAGTNRFQDRSHLTNFSFWAQIGLMMREPRAPAPRPCRDYNRMKARQESMASALYRDPIRDRERRAEENRDRNQPAPEDCPLLEESND